MRSLFDTSRDEGWAEGRAAGRAAGIEEGRAEGIRQVALALKRNGVPAATISQSTGLSVDEIDKL